MKTDILFNDRSTDVLSRCFIISPGTVGILSAWGLSNEKEVLDDGEASNTPQLIVVQKLAFTGGEFPNGQSCAAGDIPLLVDPEYLYAEDVMVCGCPWSLSSCDNMVGLAVPGTYRLQLNDTGAVGNVFVSLTRYSQTETKYVPHGIFLGEN